MNSAQNQRQIKRRLGRITAPLYHLLAVGDRGLQSADASERSDFQTIVNSGLFDVQFYIDSNPDVVAEGFEPITHFCRHGWKEGRNPSAEFNVSHYLNVYPDVAKEGINPLIHWILHGRAEGRHGTPPIHIHTHAARPSGTTPNTESWLDHRSIADGGFNPSIIFVSHDASRSGAPMVLLSMLRWIKANTDIKFGIVIGEDGPMRSEFEALAPCFLMDKYEQGEKRNKLRTFCGLNVQVVYLNTIASGSIGTDLTFLNAKFIAHVHEMESAFRVFEKSFQDLTKYCTNFIAVSEKSVEAIKKRTGDRFIEIDQIPPFIDPQAFKASKTHKIQQTPVIYGCGTLEHRKGPDIFCAVAHKLLQEGFTNFQMEWIGPHSSFDIEAEIARLGIASHVKWGGAHQNPRELMENGEIFICSSREDPFPLVCLEAAERGVPVICFDERAGSMHQFVENDAGIVVDHLNVDALAKAVRTLLDDDSLRQRLGARAQEKVRQRHLTEAACQQILELLPPLEQSTATSEFEAYKEQIDKAEIVSFDIFDTLITRRLSNPSTVFDIVEHRHSHNEVAAVALLGERMHVAGTVLGQYNGKKDDISIDEIYENMSFFRDESIEKSTEIDVVAAHPLGVELYRYAKLSGKHVILVSDMYLDEQTISAMLAKCGLASWDKLFLSSSLGQKKDTGRLFKTVSAYAAEMDIKPDQILHIGDNWDGDVRQAMDAGMQAIRFVPLYDKPYRRFPLLADSERRLSQIGRIWNDFTTQAAKLWHSRNASVAKDLYVNLGFEVSGPLASMMAMYTRMQADKLAVTKIVFMARDGRIIKKAFEALYRDEIAQGRYEIVYAHLSRAVVIPATLQHPLTSSDLYFLIEGLQFGQKPVRYFVEKAGLSCDDVEVIRAVKRHFIGLDSVPAWADLLAMTSLMRDLSEHIYAANAPAREDFATYLNDRGLDRDERVLLVDVGWLLNIQSRFDHFCQTRNIPTRSIGAYVGSRDRVDKTILHSSLLFDGGDPKFYADMIEENTTLFEILFSSPEPAASGLVRKENGAVAPTLKGISLPPSKEFTVAQKIHYGAEAFFEDFATGLKSFMPDRISKDFFFAAFEALVHSSDPELHSEFNNFEVLLGGHHELVAYQNLLKAPPPARLPANSADEYFAPMTLSTKSERQVLIVTSAGLDNGSTRYRAIHLGRSLDAMDVGSTLLHAATDIGEFETLLATADAVVFQRCFRGQGNVGAMLDHAKSLGKRCVMEMDDLMFSEFVPVIGSVAGGQWNLAEANAVASSYEAMMDEMDGAIASTDVIASHIAHKWGFNVAIYHNRVEHIGAKKSALSGPLRILYASGTFSHKEDYEQIADIVADLMTTHSDVHLSLLGSTQVPSALLALPNVASYPVLPYDEMLAFVAKHSLLIVPLVDNIFNHAKSNVKLIEAASVGVPVLASPVSEYERVIDNEVNGFIADSPQEWREKLIEIARDPSVLTQIGANSQTSVEQHWLCSTLDQATITSLQVVLFGEATH